MGLPWIVGYKPKRNYQASIFGAIDRYLSSNQDVVYEQLPPKMLAVADDGAAFVDAPKLELPSVRPWQLERLDDRFHETCVMELMVWWRIPRLRLAKRGAGSWQDGGE
jgi:hypothetical protein